MALLVLFTLVPLTACGDGPEAKTGVDRIGASATLTHVHGLGVDASGTLFVATHNGLLTPGKDGHWVYAGPDVHDHMGFSLHAKDGIMYRSGHSTQRPNLGVESSKDGGKSWSHLADVTDPPIDFHAMAVSFADSKALWGWSYGAGTFRSTDGGRTWTSLDPKGIESQIYTFAGPPEHDVLLAGTESGLYRSEDGGSTWSRIRAIGDGWVLAVAADATDPQYFLVSTPGGVKVTEDGGRTWRVASHGLPAEVSSIAISPTDRDIAFAADSKKVYRTTNGGDSWTEL